MVFLVPGFFGFTQLGTLNYFHRVSDVLEEHLRRRGLRATVRETSTLPTSSIRRRARSLAREVEEAGGLEAEHLHFVGHSTGGLDLRMMLCPTVDRGGGSVRRAVQERTRTAVCLATPHFGTPLADFFTSVNGHRLLWLLTTLVTSNPGRLYLWIMARLLQRWAQFDDLAGQTDTLLDTFAEELLEHVRPERGEHLWKFLEQVARDQGLTIQLIPEAMDLFDAAVTDHPGVRYVSFATAGRPPSLSWRSWRGENLYNTATMALYVACHTLTSRVHHLYRYPDPSPSRLRELERVLDMPVTANTNDGIVPTLSQVRGELGGVVLGDHLDVVGQFPHDEDGEHYDGWVHSGCGFCEADFRRLWDRVAGIVAEST